MGGKSDSSSNPSADLQAQIAKQLYDQTNPLRQAFINRSSNFLGIPPAQAPVPSAAAPEPQINSSPTIRFAPGFGPTDNIAAPPVASPAPATGSKPGTPQFDPSQSFLYGPAKSAIEGQYRTAKDSIISSLPAGGALTTNLANLQGQKARTLSNTLSDITQQEYNTALGLATGGTSQAMSGLGQAGAIQAQIDAANQAREGQAKSGLGSGIGFLAGTALGGPMAGKAGAAAGGAAGGKR